MAALTLFRQAAADKDDAALALFVVAPRALVVAVEDSMWRRHLEELSPQMVARINGQLGDGILRFIEFRVQPKTFEDARQNDLASAAFKAAEVPSAINLAAQSIADLRLRKVFLEAATEYLAKQGRSE